MRLKACLAAALAALVALLALAPLSAMASDDPLADLAQAEADLKAAKAALVGYEGTGVLGFYRHEGATDAVRVLTDPSVTKYQDHIRLDDPDGPTALSKVRTAPARAWTRWRCRTRPWPSPRRKTRITCTTHGGTRTARTTKCNSPP